TAEYQRFLGLLGTAGVEVLYLPRDETVGLDSLYARDASIVCDAGVILCNMGKPQRRTEPAAQEAALRRAGVSIRGRITGDGRLEGGDVCWIDGRTVAVGRGYRTNEAGIRQLRDLRAGGRDGGGESGDPGPAGAGRRDGARVPGAGDLPQGGRRAHLPHATAGAGGQMTHAAGSRPYIGTTPLVEARMTRTILAA